MRKWILLLLFVGAAIFVSTRPQHTASSNPSSPSAPSVAVALPPPIIDFSAHMNTWEKGGFGSVALVDVSFSNDNKIAVKDAELTCWFYGASGTELSRQTKTIYEIFPAGKTKRIKNINMGFVPDQASKASCAAGSVSRA
jgi:hypothetical protein